VNIPKGKVWQAAKRQRNLAIKLALYWLWIWLCMADWLLKIRRNEKI